MAILERGKKYLNYLFLNTTPGATQTWSRVAKSTEWTDSMNPNEVTFDYIADSAPTTEIENYDPTASIPYSAYMGDPVFDFVFELYINQKTGTDLVTDVLRVYQKKTGGENVATMTSATIIPQEFNDVEQTISFDIRQRGTPTQGTATIGVDDKPTFAPTVTP